MSVEDTNFDWLAGMADFRNPVPHPSQGFVRTVHIGNKRDGCFMCGRKRNLTRHHIRRGFKPVAVYLCRRHHEICHAVGLHRFRTADIRMVLAISDRYSLWKEKEAKLVKMKLEIVLRERELDNSISAWFNGNVFES